MLKIDFSLACGIYIFLFLIIFAIYWLLVFIKARSKMRKEYVQCNVCTHVFEIESSKDLSICPRCQSYHNACQQAEREERR